MNNPETTNNHILASYCDVMPRTKQAHRSSKAMACQPCVPKIESMDGLQLPSLRGAPVSERRSRDDDRGSVRAEAVRHPSGRGALVPSRWRIEVTRALSLAAREAQGCAGPCHRAWAGRFERFELYARHRGK